jgi:predicted phage-related endonuclease
MTTIADIAQSASNIELEIQKLESQLEPLKKLLIEKGPASYATTNGSVVVTKTEQSITFNTTQFKSEQPEMYEKYKNQIKSGYSSVKFDKKFMESLIKEGDHQ